MASELEVKPWKTQIQGPTAHFNIDVVYANFTTENADIPFTTSSGPTVNYQVVVNVTNPSDYAAKLYNLYFGAAKTVTETTGQGLLGNKGNWTSGGGFEAKGAWVDGVWYNVSYVNGTYPFFDANGTMTNPPFNIQSSEKGHWMEGVQGYELNGTVHDNEGTHTYTYLNMNGTWTDVTGRITVDKPQNGATYALYGVLANQNLFFQRTANHNTTVTITNDLNKTAGLPPDSTQITTAYPNGGISTTIVPGRLNDTAGIARDSSMKFRIDTGEGGFDNLFAPHESRLIVIQGTFEARAYSTTTDKQAPLQRCNQAS